MRFGRSRCRFIAGAVILAGVLALTGCVSIRPENAIYPSDWPALVPADQTRCAPPTGTFKSISSRAHYSEGYRFPAPSLAAVLDPAGALGSASFLSLDKSTEGTLVVRSYRIVDGQQQLVSEATVDSSRFECQEDRWFVASSSTHEGWDSYHRESYDPAYIAAHYVMTFGLGTPLSSWWNYLFVPAVDGSLVLRRQNMSSAVVLGAIYGRSAMDDDFFLFPATDVSAMIAEAPADETPGTTHVAYPQDAATISGDCRQSQDASATDLFETGRSLYGGRAYAAARECFEAAIEHPAGAHTEAMWYLCVMYENGYGVERDLATARQWCTRMQKAAP